MKKAKEIIQVQETATRYFEILEEVDGFDIDDKKIKIAKSKGQFSLEQLEQQKIGLQTQLDNVNKHISLINNLIAKD